MSWRSREERGSRWEANKWDSRERSPVWEVRHVSPERRSPPRHRHAHERRDHRRDRRDRHERDRDRDRQRERDRDRKRHEDSSPPPPPPPPPIITDDRSPRRSRSKSREKVTDMEIEKEHHEEHRPHEDYGRSSPGDWICRCGLYNFKRRQVCYRRTCNGTRAEGVLYLDGERGSEGITKKLLFRRLDALTTEEKILEELKKRCSKEILDSIVGISIGRESLTGASKCLAYISFNSIADSTAAHTELVSLQPPLHIDGREVLISYCNDKKMVKYQDYTPYYPPQVVVYNNPTTQAMSEADRVNAAAAVAQSAISAAQARQLSWTPVTSSHTSQSSTTNIPTGDGKTVYPAPDVRTFLYDESSGFYYDPSTCLYYDGKTQYFYNSQISQYLYWDGKTSTYHAVSQAQNAEQHKQKEGKEPDGKKRGEKEDKVKVAKKIAKDMERWAKTLNQKKENARSNIVMEQPTDNTASKGSADIGFSVLGAGPALTHVREISPPPTTDEFLIKKITEPVVENDDDIIDWAKLTCLLCKRKFPSVDVLNKHKTMSDLHKQNLAEFRKKNDLIPQMNGYRDRAAERRMKFGEDDAPIIRKRYEPPEPMGPPINPHPPPNVVDTIGGKMLQKMGWSEGRGLGKTEQGRIAPIEAEQRPSLAGLGQKRGIYTPTPGETYRDTVKKLMIARYKEVVGQEDGK